jgi:hypothetical protein
MPFKFPTTILRLVFPTWLIPPHTITAPSKSVSFLYTTISQMFPTTTINTHSSVAKFQIKLGFIRKHNVLPSVSPPPKKIVNLEQLKRFAISVCVIPAWSIPTARSLSFWSKRGIDLRVEKLFVEVAFCLQLQTTQFMTFNYNRAHLHIHFKLSKWWKTWIPETDVTPFCKKK